MIQFYLSSGRFISELERSSPIVGWAHRFIIKVSFNSQPVSLDIMAPLLKAILSLLHTN